ncbi:MAG: AI-2E family transporter [Anaerolineales bacterium]|nr:AI-2E family transporter [Anaerolineales bacterium]
MNIADELGGSMPDLAVYNLTSLSGLLGPVILAFVLAYLLLPLITLVRRTTHLSWKLSVSLVYLVVVLLLIGLLTLGGVGIIQQVQLLVETVQENVDRLPEYIARISVWKFSLGPYVVDFASYDWEKIGNQVLGYVEPALGEIGSVVGSLATGAATTIGWIFFCIFVSYFSLFESGGLRDRIIQVEIPIYAEDIRRLGAKLGRIWNAFLRGQMIIFLLTSTVYAIALSALGVRYALVLALITGFANFIPYIGPAINWVVLGLVTYFQPFNYFGLSPLGYMLLVIAVAILIDQVFNNLVTPRVMARALKVHPAFVLIAALAAANLIGVIGVIIAAPLLATVQLVGGYIVRKLLDRDPWPPEEEVPPPPPLLPPWLKQLFARKPKPADGNDALQDAVEKRKQNKRTKPGVRKNS